MSALTEAIRRLQPDNLVFEKEARATKRAQRRLQAIALLGGQCLDCGDSFPDTPEVYEFDHTRGVKRTEIARLLYGSWKALAEELKKCDLVCANCHAKRTAHRRPGNRCE